jgi:hypothetical protein
MASGCTAVFVSYDVNVRSLGVFAVWRIFAAYIGLMCDTLDSSRAT